MKIGITLRRVRHKGRRDRIIVELDTTGTDRIVIDVPDSPNLEQVATADMPDPPQQTQSDQS